MVRVTVSKLPQITLAALAWIGLCGSASATDYFFSQSAGSDSNSGLSSNAPKQSLGQLDSLLESASPGDRFLLRRGDQWNGSISEVSGATGAAGNHIIVGTYGSGALPVLYQSGGGNGINIRGESSTRATSYITFQDIRIECNTGIPRINRAVGVNMIETWNGDRNHNVTFDGLEIVNCKFGMAIQGSENSSAYNEGLLHDVILENMYVAFNYDSPQGEHSQGLFLHGCENCTIRDSEFEGNGKPNWGFDHNMYLSGSTGLVVENNYVHGQYSGIKVRKGSNILIRGNRFDDSDFSNLTIGSDSGRTYSTATIEGNFFSGSERGINIKAQSDGGSVVDNLTLQNNVFFGHTNAAIMVRDTAFNNSRILHNTVYVASGNGLRIEGDASASNVDIKNNIFSGNSSADIGFASSSQVAGSDIDSNLYEGGGGRVAAVGGSNYSSLSSFRSATSQEASGQQASPGFVNASANDFALSSSSPARDAAVSVGVSVDMLYAARTVGSGPDIGALEFGGTPTAPPPPGPNPTDPPTDPPPDPPPPTPPPTPPPSETPVAVGAGTTMPQTPSADVRFDFSEGPLGHQLPDWIDTRPNFSMSEDDSIFSAVAVGSDPALSTGDSGNDVHSHVFGVGGPWTEVIVRGRMAVDRSTAEVGVTALSNYPQSDTYYRLGRDAGQSFTIEGRPGLSCSTADTGVTPVPGAWYRFQVAVFDDGSARRIQAKVWRENAAEPSTFQAECSDTRAGRLAAGTVGAWASGDGNKYWDDIEIDVISSSAPPTSTPPAPPVLIQIIPVDG